MKFTFQRIDPRSASESELRGLHTAFVDRDKDFHPGDPEPSFEYNRANWLAPGGIHRQESWWAAAEDGEIIGGSRAITWADHADSGLVVTAVRADHRRRGIGMGLLAHSIDDLEAAGRSKLIIDAPADSPASARLEQLGMRRALAERISRLRVSELDWDLIDSWIDRAPARAGEYELVFFDGRVPDEHLENWARINEVMNSAPLEDLELEDAPMSPEKWRSMEENYHSRGFEFRGSAAVHRRTEDFAGLTVLLHQRFRPWLSLQDDTGVAPDHRNRGLGRWLKAAMLRRFLAEFPEVEAIETGNAGSNEPMLNINMAMGFTTELVVNAWQGEIETVRDRLGV